MATPSGATVCLLHGLIGAGQPLLLVHPRTTAEERRRLLGAVAHQPLIEPAALELDGHASDPPGGVPDDERPLALVPTSGSSGAPKAAVLSRRAFVASARASAARLPLGADDRWLCCLPLAHVGGFSILTRCLLARRSVVLVEPKPDRDAPSAEQILTAIERERPSLISLVPTQLKALLELGLRAPGSLRAVLLGGAGCSPALLEEARGRGLPVLTSYGLTEACSTVTMAALPPGEHQGAGRPLPGIEVRVAAGQIQVRGPTLFSGYEPVSPSPEGLTSDGWLPTGDAGRFDAEGNLHVRGRQGELIVTGGENVSPAEIEATLERCPGVAAACAFGLPDDTWGEVVCAAIVPASSGLDRDTLAGFVRTNLASFKRPRRIAVVAELCLGPTGKLDRRATRAAAADKLEPL